MKLKPRTVITACISMPALTQWSVSFPFCYHDVFHAFSATVAYIVPFWPQGLHACNPGVRINSSFSVCLAFCHSKMIIVNAESYVKKRVHCCEQPVSALCATLKSPILLFSINWTPPTALSQCKPREEACAVTVPQPGSCVFLIFSLSNS